ncbi:HAMP domain-containing protein [Diaphorobacter sp. JS3050]|uniref:methyl-accepting chemotaxis protein n=1 Tax=unclassified Diaphorobacter TaxID=2649760 RepID=UPI001552C2AE|nr:MULTISPECIES: methyl-accepting chemotaxis protein [unclassified Diaphorobacter]QJY34398.1 HAMP domain-containing protein [Diaphorobacter sp. JS3050]QPN30341.1 HAMP domain-containing protein [Diaphorobacter sp. JS3051]QYY25152.1 HAMP domain-containing protein [Diaphorobacter sp. MNS-0]
MRVLGQLSIRARLYFATTFSLVLLTAVGALGYVALDRSRSTLQELFARQVQTLTDMAELRTGLGHLRRAEKDIIINFNNAVEVQALREGWSRQLDALRKSMAQVREVQAGNVEFTGALDKALAEVGQYEGGLVPIFDQIERALLDGAGAGAYAERFKAHMDTTDALLASLATQARGHMEEARAALDQRTATMSMLIAAAVLLGLAVLVPLTLFSVRSITQSLEQARALAERIAAGDLSHAVQSRQRDEIGSLVAAMGRMQDALRTLVGQVQQAAGSIATASDEIALGNQDLSQRTEQTAASLQQTASSMELLTGTVQHSAESSRQASGLAANAAEVAVRGGAVVAQVVQTMGEISDSSRRIGDITGVIDSIAFQTNILALNAAVEAARAGEQGRGFAVVASEVRSLAQRSADAAKEIKALIGASVERVEGGSRLVAQAGETMTEIVASVRRVSDIVAEITSAAAEQAGSIGQVGQSVSHLDQMTQQNAALVEESAAASQSLRDQAGRLTEAVSRFKLQGGAPQPGAVALARATTAREMAEKDVGLPALAA